MTEVTRILNQIEDGDPSAAEKLLPLVYDELRKLASAKFQSEQPGHTLQTTALVHEAYIRLVDKGEDTRWNSRGHFFGAAAEAMRRILVERARRKRTAKHGGDLHIASLNETEAVAPESNVDLIALDEALRNLETQDARKAELVKLRYFAGMTIRQAAESLGISESTADADWAYAKSWLKVRMSP